MTILTDEQIECELQDAVIEHLDMPNLLARECFTLGRDQGTAETLEKARTMLVAQVADERTVQLGRSVAAILAWCAAVPGRSWNPGTTISIAFLADSDLAAGAEHRCEFFEGSDPNEALGKLATWCTEHAARAVVADPFPVTSDTISAPPPFEPVAADKCYLESGE